MLRRRVVVVDPEDAESVAGPLVQGPEVRRFFPARPAPGRPDVDHGGLAGQAGQRDVGALTQARQGDSRQSVCASWGAGAGFRTRLELFDQVSLVPWSRTGLPPGRD